MTRRTRRSVVAASEPQVEEVAKAAVAQGTAVDAVVSAVFAAAALEPSVLFGPLQALVGGAGAGLRAVDGRVRQPGLGLPRPRGFVTPAEVPAAARVAVPALPSALAVLLATFGSVSLARAVAPALDLAKSRSAGRWDVLKRIAQRGPTGLLDARIAGELIASAGRVAGGLLSERDLAEVRPAVAVCEAWPVGALGVATVPWGAAAVRDDAECADGSRVHVVIVLDARGLAAAACYESSAAGLHIPELDLLAAPYAAPVMRGEPRFPASRPRAAAAPIALGESDDVLVLAAGVYGEPSAERRLGRWLRAGAFTRRQDDAHLILAYREKA